MLIRNYEDRVVNLAHQLKIKEEKKKKVFDADQDEGFDRLTFRNTIRMGSMANKLPQPNMIIEEVDENEREPAS